MSHQVPPQSSDSSNNYTTPDGSRSRDDSSGYSSDSYSASFSQSSYSTSFSDSEESSTQLQADDQVKAEALRKLAAKIREQSVRKPKTDVHVPTEPRGQHPRAVSVVPPALIEGIHAKTAFVAIRRANEGFLGSNNEKVVVQPRAAPVRDPALTLTLLANRIREATRPVEEDTSFLCSEEGRPVLVRRFLAEATSDLATVQVERMRLAREALAATNTRNCDGRNERPDVFLAVQEAVASAKAVLDAYHRVYGES
jgi:hypothetical protein